MKTKDLEGGCFRHMALASDDRKFSKNFSQDRWCLGADLDRVPPAHSYTYFFGDKSYKTEKMWSSVLRSLFTKLLI